MALWDELTRPEIRGREVWEWNGTTFETNTYGGMVEGARRSAAGLRKRGVGPGTIVPAVLTNGPDTAPGAMGIIFAGASIASLPIIARGMTIPNYVAQLARLCKMLGADFLLAEERFMAFMPTDAELGFEVIGFRSLIETSELAAVEPPELDDVNIIQFSSGTTSEPLGAELTGTAIEAQLRMLAERLSIDPERDVGCMWLPLSHDMGLFGCALLAWYTGMSAVKSTPERFLQSPRSWFEDCSEFGVTVTAGPPSAIGVAARAERAHSSKRPLRLRLCLVGAEHIDWRILTEAADVFAPRGLGIEAFTPAYGLAEATLAVAVSDPDQVPRYLDVDRDALVGGEVKVLGAEDPAARRLVSAGVCLPGTSVTIEPQTSEIVVSSASLASGYHHDAQASNDRFRDGSFWTADLGFVHDGQLYISGRSDDLLNIRGRSVHVLDLEARLGSEHGIRAGNCAIVDIDNGGRRQIGVVAEVASEEIEHDRLAGRLRRRIMELGGVPVETFVFLPRGAFPKTPSGKVQRYRCREILSDPDTGSRVASSASRMR